MACSSTSGRTCSASAPHQRRDGHHGAENPGLHAGWKPLPKRRNIVITRSPGFSREGVEAAHSVQEALDLAASDDGDKVWVIGGGEIYAALLPYCRLCYLTRVYARPDCDVFFPDLDTRPEWQILRSGAIVSDGALDYQFIEYINRELP